MPSLKEVKNRITSILSTQQITKAMKMVAAAKLRRAQDNIIQLRPYASKMNGLLQNLMMDSDVDESNAYGEEREVNRVLIMAVTSDRGLCGAFNSNIHKEVIRHIDANYKEIHANGDVHILPLGKKGFDYFRKRNYTIVDDFWEVFSDLSFANATKGAVFAMEKFLNREYDRIDIVYNEFKNVATQIMRVEQFLPVLPVELKVKEEVEYIYQPSKEAIVSDLVPKSLKTQVYKALLESNASEQGARMTAMDQATDNAGELLKDLRLTYNRTRQAAITKEINEIVAGADALG
ncbi:MAG: ATP synthase F1 subunit gamma [Cyclobacteriaceae bacterium]|nr:ATP synthase F1 subunit gamma [Cyclobacteriaceae bacterium]